MNTPQHTTHLAARRRLNRLAGIEYPDDPKLRARIKSYELAFGMQRAVPEALDMARETAEIGLPGEIYTPLAMD